MKNGAETRDKTDGERDGKAPLKNKAYEMELRRLQAELCQPPTPARPVVHREVRRQESLAVELRRPLREPDPHERVRRKKIEMVGRSSKRAADDEAPMKKRRWIPEAY